mmetsp:Transcript_28486/g.64499  ORF Transcript_28486/g.64499 Transcript_28486/m.64499 type:complete len:98 (-) Transcript_28486:494-787(-)
MPEQAKVQAVEITDSCAKDRLDWERSAEPVTHCATGVCGAPVALSCGSPARKKSHLRIVALYVWVRQRLVLGLVQESKGAFSGRTWIAPCRKLCWRS